MLTPDQVWSKHGTAKAVEQQSLNPAQADRTLAASEVAWIVWARR